MKEAGSFLLMIAMLILAGGVLLVFLLLTALANVAYPKSRALPEGTTGQLSFREFS